jgi:uncharacterized protein with von Willebrand factor type A (vWA) domain
MVKWLRQSKSINAATTGARQENDMDQTQTVTIEEVKSLAEQLGALGKDANQTQLAEAIAGSYTDTDCGSQHTWRKHYRQQ